MRQENFVEKLSHLPLILMQVGSIFSVGAYAVSCAASTMYTSETKSKAHKIFLFVDKTPTLYLPSHLCSSHAYHSPI
jgi:hypothetical protein